MATSSIENRLNVLERAVADLQKRLSSLADPNRRWWIDDAGRFANDSAFDEIVRLGRAYRKSQRRPHSPKRDRT